MSCDGVVIGLPLEGEKMLLGASMSMRASICASMDSGTVHGHLVTVEVRVVGGADERVDADSLALDQHRLEGLDSTNGAGWGRDSGAPGCPLVTSSKMSQTSGV